VSWSKFALALSLMLIPTLSFADWIFITPGSSATVGSTTVSCNVGPVTPAITLLPGLFVNRDGHQLSLRSVSYDGPNVSSFEFSQYYITRNTWTDATCNNVSCQYTAGPNSGTITIIDPTHLYVGTNVDGISLDFFRQ
jgi:hypothetical protein